MIEEVTEVKRVVCDNKKCGYEEGCLRQSVDPVEEEVSANYCGFNCAIEAEGFISGFFLKLVLYLDFS